MRLYITGTYDNRFLLQLVGYLLSNRGYQITSRWLTSSSDNNEKNTMIPGFEDIDSADALLCFYPTNSYDNNNNNIKSEMTYAYAKGKEVYYIREEIFSNNDPLMMNLSS